MKLVIKIRGEEVYFNVEEARRLYCQLASIFEANVHPYPYPKQKDDSGTPEVLKPKLPKEAI